MADPADWCWRFSDYRVIDSAAVRTTPCGGSAQTLRAKAVGSGRETRVSFPFDHVGRPTKHTVYPASRARRNIFGCQGFNRFVNVRWP